MRSKYLKYNKKLIKLKRGYMNILEKKIVNSGRQIELDIAKGLAILFMIAVHIQSELGNPSIVLEWISILFYIKKFIPVLVQDILKRWSLNVNSIYIIHWIIISLAGSTIGFYSLNFMYSIIVLILTIGFSDFASVFFKMM